jgi:hypothetical protein
MRRLRVVLFTQIASSRDAKTAAVDHLFQWHSLRKKEIPSEAAELKLEMERLQNVRLRFVTFSCFMLGSFF